MPHHGFFLRAALAAFVLALPAAAPARTTCVATNGSIAVTLHIDFAGASNGVAGAWVREIDEVWNGPAKRRFYGACRCPVVFRVATNHVAAGSSMRPGWHLIHVVPWRDGALPVLPYGPRAHERVVGYMGKTTRSPPQRGASVDGEWSEVASRLVEDPAQQGQRYKDAAHEAGHMMGLPDDYHPQAGWAGSNIMGRTSGPWAVATPELVRKAVDGLTGKTACPLCGRP